MDRLIKAGRIFFGISIAAVGFLQLYYSDFHAMILPPLHAWIPGLALWAWLTGVLFVAAGAAIAFKKNARTVSLALGGFLFLIFCIYYIPYQFIVNPYYKHLGVWGDAEKELALSGGAFIMAGSFSKEPTRAAWLQSVTNILEKFIPFGRIFFSITMISFGIDHLLYTANIATLVPAWIPYPVFWTYFAALGLIASGTSIVFRIIPGLVGSLLGLMIFLWLIILHLPRAVEGGFAEKGNEVISALSALAFAGIAFVIAGLYLNKNDAVWKFKWRDPALY